MKQLLSTIALLIAGIYAQANVFTVSNNAGNPAQYSDISSALTAASPGDSIYIYGSTTPYTAPVFSKDNITFIGPGFNPQKQLALAADCGNYYNAWTIGNGDKFYGLSFYAYRTGSSVYNVTYPAAALAVLVPLPAEII